MNWDDEDFYDNLDKSMAQAADEAEQARLRMKTYHIVSFYGYKQIRYMQNWRPLGLKEYVDLLLFSEKQKIERDIRRATGAQNKRILRDYRIKPKKGDYFD